MKGAPRDRSELGFGAGSVDRRVGRDRRGDHLDTGDGPEPMRYCETEGFCSVFGHRTVDSLPCVRRPLPEPIRIVSGAILLLATLWWLIVALWLAMPAMATEEIEDEWGIHLVEIGEPLEIVDLDWWRLDWSERVLEAGGLTQDFLDEWQAMAELHGCDWPGTTCRTPGPQDEIARSPGRPATIATGSTGGPTVPPSTPSSVESWRSSLAVYAGWDVDRMLRIMACESGGNPSAVSHTDDHGLLQIHYPIWGPAFGVTREQLWDPGINIDIAWRVWSQQGYGAWVCDRG